MPKLAHGPAVSSGGDFMSPAMHALQTDKRGPLLRALHCNTCSLCLHVLNLPVVHALQIDEDNMCSTHLLCMLLQTDEHDMCSTHLLCMLLQADEDDVYLTHLLCMLCRLMRTTSSSKRCSSTCGATCTAQAPPPSCGQLWPRCQANPSSGGCSPGPIKGGSLSYKWGGMAMLSQSHRCTGLSIQPAVNASSVSHICPCP